VFALGDCANSPNAKTAAAVSGQFKAVKINLANQMNGKECTEEASQFLLIFSNL
jgi:NADH dehydrogenase FAD-containing subunit